VEPDVPPRTGDERADAALQQVADLAAVPVEDQAAALRAAQEALLRLLDTDAA